MNPSDVTFIIPVYKLDTHRKNNLNFILPYIRDTGCRVLVVEQTNEKKSDLTDLINKIGKVEHILFETAEERFHKTGIINHAISKYVTTKYAWVNDSDYYMKFQQVLDLRWAFKFIQPYSIAKKLNRADSSTILSGKRLDVNFSDPSTKYISMYGALSFIFDVDEFISIGAMDESIYGWGYEDVELSNRVTAKYDVKKIEYEGIHLWHPIKSESTKNKDIKRDMAVITCHFNWCGYVTPDRNLNRFLFLMESANIPVYGVELSLTDNFVTKDRPNWKHIKVKKENICFQKEACLNLIETLLPQKYTKIAWIDYDMHFSNENWYQEASEKLETYKLLQLYSTLIETDKTGKAIIKKESTVYLGGPLSDGRWNGPPAGALAARREMWRNGGLYPYSFLGASDGIFINTLYDVPMWLKNEESSKNYTEWKSKIQKYISKKDISFVEGDILHEWHGDKDGRNYYGRNFITEGINYDTDIFLNDDGILEIVKSKIGVVDNIIDYFEGRNEDGMILSTSLSGKFKRDMAVVSCFFNWANFETPKNNLQRFKWQMDAKEIPFYGVELSFTDDFVSSSWKNWIKIKVSERNVCFQKEACINLIEKIIPDEYRKIAWIDPDIHFSNENWYIDASKELDTYTVIQLFDSYITTDKSGNVIMSLPSVASSGGTKNKNKNQTHSGVPGGAWAARRDLWMYGGLYPYSIMGGGDAVFVYTIYEDPNFKEIMNLSGSVDFEKYAPYLNWKKAITSYVKQDISFIKGEIRHEWHGDMNKRGYGNRYEILKKINFPTDVRIGRNGLMEITVQSIYIDILNYFKSRDEDGINNFKNKK